MASVLSRVPCAKAHHRERPAGPSCRSDPANGRVTAAESTHGPSVFVGPSRVRRLADRPSVGVMATRSLQSTHASVDDSGCSSWIEPGLDCAFRGVVPRLGRLGRCVTRKGSRTARGFGVGNDERGAYRGNSRACEEARREDRANVSTSCNYCRDRTTTSWPREAPRLHA